MNRFRVGCLAPGLLSACIALAAPTASALPAFPGAEGFGADTVGGRGGAVYVVTTTADYDPDTDTPIVGSLRHALEVPGVPANQPHPRMVVFATSGIIEVLEPIRIDNGSVTVAGQSAPGGGILLRRKRIGGAGQNALIRVIGDDVVIRHLRLRGGLADNQSGSHDGLAIQPGAERVVVDHCSISWNNDENVSLANGAKDVTIQWSIISEGLRYVTGEGYGLLADFSDGSLSLHHNLFAHNWGRTPNLSAEGVHDFVNNVVYNTKGNAAMQILDATSGSGALPAQPLVNYVGNYIQPGLDSAPNQYAIASYHFAAAFDPDGPGAQVFWAGNANGNGVDPPAAGEVGYCFVDGTVDLSCAFTSFHTNPANRFAAPPLAEQDAATARAAVLAGAGATLPVRDSVDECVLGTVTDPPTGRLITNMGQGCAVLPSIPVVAGPSDADGDGMPDAWESSWGFDPDDAADGGPCGDPLGACDADGDGYTNLEEYLNDTDPRDSDGDGTTDADDNCVVQPNAGQEDADGDGAGDACDPCTAGDTDWLSPTLEAADTGGDDDGFEWFGWEAFADGGLFAYNNDGAGDRHRYHGYGIQLPDSCSAVGIEVRADWWLDSTAGNNALGAQLSWDAGSSWSATWFDWTETTTQHTGLIGGADVDWGHAWTAEELGDDLFRVRVLALGVADRDYYLDWLPVRVSYNHSDRDGDGVADEFDNCADDPNEGQQDADADGAGDACDPCLAGDTGWLSPTAEAADSGGDGDGFESLASSAFADEGSSASNVNGANDRHRYHGYGVELPASCSVVGIEVRADWWLDSTTGNNALGAQLSWDAGSSWSATWFDWTETTAQHTGLIGGADVDWGHEWAAEELEDASFRVRVLPLGVADRDYFLDWVPVRVWYNQ